MHKVREIMRIPYKSKQELYMHLYLVITTTEITRRACRCHDYKVKTYTQILIINRVVLGTS